MIPRGSTAVMARRVEPPDSLDFYPTPPWATRALVEHLLKPRGLIDQHDTCAEPACGEGHMAEPLREYFLRVYASDVFPYGYGDVLDFLWPGCDVPKCDWIITNPPFRLAEQFVLKALDVVRHGVAMIVRTGWLESDDRYHSIFKLRPPTYVAQFVERVPMVKGRFDPTASSATSYAWFVWANGDEETRLVWIPPGCRTELTKPDDRARFAAWSLAPTDAPLLEARQ